MRTTRSLLDPSVPAEPWYVRIGDWLRDHYWFGTRMSHYRPFPDGVTLRTGYTYQWGPFRVFIPRKPS